MGQGTTADGRAASCNERLRSIERRLESLEALLLPVLGRPSAPDSLTAGEMLRRRRRQLHDSQAAVARRLGVNQSTVSKWERGERIGWDHVADVAEYLGVAAVVVVAHNP